MHTNITLRAAAMALLITLSWPAWAADDHAQRAAAEAGKAWPSVTAASASFELVGRLEHEQLAILIDRAASNEPVLHATLRVALAGRTALLPFNAERGDYVLSDPEMLGALQQPGHKKLVFTLDTADLSAQLSGELAVDSEVPQPTDARPAAQSTAMWLGLVAVVFVLVLLLLVVLARRLSPPRKSGFGGAQ